MVCWQRWSFFETVDQSNNLVPDQFLIRQVSVFVQTVEPFSFELEPIILFNIFPQLPMDLGIFHDFDGFWVELLEVVCGFSWLFAVEQQTVVSDLAIHGFFSGNPVEIRVRFSFLNNDFFTFSSILAMTFLICPFSAITYLTNTGCAYFRPTTLLGAIP